MKKEIIIILFNLFFVFYYRTQTFHKIELDSIDLVVTLENQLIIKSKKSQDLKQDDFKINHLINQKHPIETSNLFLINLHSWYLFYYKKQLVFAYNEYWENSRMGSCGDISIYNYYFIKNNQFTNKWHFEEPFLCYQHGMLNSYEDLLKIIDKK